MCPVSGSSTLQSAPHTPIPWVLPGHQEATSGESAPRLSDAYLSEFISFSLFLNPQRVSGLVFLASLPTLGPNSKVPTRRARDRVTWGPPVWGPEDVGDALAPWGCTRTPPYGQTGGCPLAPAPTNSLPGPNQVFAAFIPADRTTLPNGRGQQQGGTTPHANRSLSEPCPGLHRCGSAGSYC